MSLIHTLITLYIWVLVVAAILSWFPVRSDGALVSVQRVLNRLCDPVLRPLRAILPRPSIGGTAIDLSVFVAIIILEIINTVI